MSKYDNLAGLLLCLAALDLSDAEVLRLIDQLRSAPTEVLLAQLGVLRRSFLSVERDLERKVERLPVMTSAPGEESSVARVTRLLRGEAHMSTSEAAAALVAELKKGGLIGTDVVPEIGKKSFAEWVHRLERHIAPKDILMCATIVRNTRVHAPLSDWKLKGTP